MPNSEWYGALEPGVKLPGGHGPGYYLKRVIGQGGFGITYEAESFNGIEGSANGATVAIKEFFPKDCAVRGSDGITVCARPGCEEEYVSRLSRFSEEGRTLTALSGCDSVVRVLSTFDANNTSYLVMEYLDGMPLYKKAMELGGRIPPEELLPRLPKLLLDIAAMHRAGILHRDITPDNIMWMPDGTLKLIDFGSARSMSQDKKTVFLKFGYSPIEQHITSGQGPYTDIYALCATIYYLLSGINPPEAVDRLDNDPLRSLISLGVALTPEEDAAILHGLAVQPMERTQTADDLLRELSPVPARARRGRGKPSFFRRLADRLLRRGRA